MEVHCESHPDFAVVFSFFKEFGKYLDLEEVSIEDVSRWLEEKATPAVAEQADVEGTIKTFLCFHY